jgi:hypothetical protein
MLTTLDHKNLNMLPTIHIGLGTEVAGFCDCGNEPSDSTKCGELLE